MSELTEAEKSPRGDNIGEIRFMAEKDGYVMCRRPHCMPFVLSKKDWTRLPDAKTARETKQLWDKHRSSPHGLIGERE